jgi:hypothetical protein
MTYKDIDAAAEEVADSEAEQADADRRRKRGDD